MPASYHITVEPQGFVQLKLSGFFNRVVFAKFAVDRDIAYRRLTCRPNAHVTLVDVSGCSLQPQDLVRLFQQMISQPGKRSRRMAFVVGDSVARMQVRRMLADRDDAQMFDEADAAATWLREDFANAA